MTVSSPTARPFRTLTDLLLFGNLQIPLVAAGLLGATPLWIDRGPQPALMLAGSAGAFLIYQIDRGWRISTEDTDNQPARVAWIRAHPRYLLVSTLVACACMILAALRLSTQTLLAGACLGLAGVAYLFAVLPGGRRLKGHWVIKPLTIAGAWAGGAILLPLLEAGITPGWDLVFLGILRLGVLVPNVLVSDWPDREGDRRAGLQSLAQMVREDTLRRVGRLSCLVALGGGIVLAGRTGWSFVAALDLAGPLIMALFLSQRFPTFRGSLLLAIDLAVAWPLVPVVVAMIN